MVGRVLWWSAGAVCVRCGGRVLLACVVLGNLTCEVKRKGGLQKCKSAWICEIYGTLSFAGVLSCPTSSEEVALTLSFPTLV